MKHNAFSMVIACSCLFAGIFLPAEATYGHRVSASVDLWCPDMNGDGVVELADAALLGPLLDTSCAPGCPGDFNHNGYVGQGDLRILLANLGPCPLQGDANLDGVVDLEDVATVIDDIGLDCHADLDHNGRVSGDDTEIAEAVWTPGPDHHPNAHKVDGNDSTLSILDLDLVYKALGRLCHSDANKDGHVNDLDRDKVCDLAGFPPQCEP